MLAKFKYSFSIAVFLSSAFALATPCAGYLTQDRSEYVELQRLLASSDGNWALHTKNTQDLHTLLEGFVPVSYAQRRWLLRQLFSAESAATMDVGDAPKYFANRLGTSLAGASRLNDTDEEGEFILLKALRSLDSFSDGLPLSPELRAELITLLETPEAREAFQNLAAEPVERIRQILASRLPADPQRRSRLISRVFPLWFATALDYESESFAYRLLELLASSGQLTERDVANQFLVVQLIEDVAPVITP